jgi:hypothetical protein
VPREVIRTQPEGLQAPRVLAAEPPEAIFDCVHCEVINVQDAEENNLISYSVLYTVQLENVSSGAVQI